MPCELGDNGTLFIRGLPALLASVEAFEPPESTLVRRYGSAGEALTPASASSPMATSDGLSVRTSERGANASVCFVRGDLGEWGGLGERSCFGEIAGGGRDRVETMAGDGRAAYMARQLLTKQEQCRGEDVRFPGEDGGYRSAAESPLAGGAGPSGDGKCG